MEQPVDVAETSFGPDDEMGYAPLELPRWIVLLEGIIAILIGFFLIQILGIFWLAEGILSVIGGLIYSGNRVWKLLSGILSIIAGAVILMYPIYSSAVVLTLFVIFIGIWAVITGVVKIVLSFKGGGRGIGIIGILTIILGLLLLVNFAAGVLVLPWVFGLFLILGGIGTLIEGFRT